MVRNSPKGLCCSPVLPLPTAAHSLNTGPISKLKTLPLKARLQSKALLEECKVLRFVVNGLKIAGTVLFYLKLQSNLFLCASVCEMIIQIFLIMSERSDRVCSSIWKSDVVNIWSRKPIPTNTKIYVLITQGVCMISGEFVNLIYTSWLYVFFCWVAVTHLSFHQWVKKKDTEMWLFP